MKLNGYQLVSECLGKETDRPVSTLNDGVVTGAKSVTKDYMTDPDNSIFKDMKVNNGTTDMIKKPEATKI